MFPRARSRREDRPSPRQEVNPPEDPTVATARRKRLGRIAWWLTGVWCFLFVLGLWRKFEDVSVMSLNEWGDFFAGAAAPLALLWLVIGYFQHGEELRLSTQALYAQQLELQRQVEETAQLVEATKENVRIMHARDAREAAPQFRKTGTISGRGRFSVKIQNIGAEVRDVKLQCHGPHEYRLPERENMPRGAEIEFSVLHGNAPLIYPINFEVSCVDGLDNIHNIKFVIPEADKVFRLSVSDFPESTAGDNYLS